MAPVQALGQGAAVSGSAGPPHPYDKRWYVHLNGKTYGPYTGHQIRQMVEQHEVVASDFVYAEADSGSAWQPIANDPILGALFKSADARRPPLVPRIKASPGFRKWLFAIPVVIVGWTVWPYYAVYDLVVAARNGDVSCGVGQRARRIARRFECSAPSKDP
jgi:GYF domain 2